jgi:hypothetical protein
VMCVWRGGSDVWQGGCLCCDGEAGGKAANRRTGCCGRWQYVWVKAAEVVVTTLR